VLLRLRFGTRYAESENGREGDAERADECMAAGDTDGQRIWKYIVDAILELLREKPDEGERVN